MNWPTRIARLVVHHRRGMLLGLLAGTLLCAGVLVMRLRLDTEVLNLLPAHFESVQALKLYNSEFSQARELTFALYKPDLAPEDGSLDDFKTHFAAELRLQPWVQRVLEGSPIETEEGLASFQSMAVPLLLNLDPVGFAEAIGRLTPEALQLRLARLRSQVESGSPKAEMELALDPLGLVGPALKPLAGSSALDRAEILVSADRTMHLIQVVARMANLGDFECRRIMGEVETFNKKMLEEWHADQGTPPQILVTGRSAFVAEISGSMLRDLGYTVLSSVALVCGIFFLGFRRVAPLVGILAVLLITSVVAMTTGALLFGQLNVITIGFCSILVGLGIDFGLLLCGAYQHYYLLSNDREAAIAGSLRHVGPGIFYGGLTTAAAFLAFVFSDSRGFSQLGTLIAIGIMLCALFMCVLLFLFIPERPEDPVRDWLAIGSRRYIHSLGQFAFRILCVMAVLLLALAAVGLAPAFPVPFDSNPRALEPRNSQAGTDLRLIESKMIQQGEPFILFLQAENPSQFHDYWQKLTKRLEVLQREGKIRSFSTPAALVLSPEKVEENRRALAHLDFSAVEAAFRAGIDAAGFNASEFKAGFLLLEKLRAATQSNSIPEWKQELPESSSWWFLIDRFLASKPFAAAGFVAPNEKIKTVEQRSEIKELLQQSGVPVWVSGWSFTMIDLMPWTRRELVLLSGVVSGALLAILAAVYRRFSYWILHVLAMAFAMLAMLATVKLFDIKLNLLNVLAFPLMLGVGVDYGIHVLLAVRDARDVAADVGVVVKSVFLCALTTIAGFGSLRWAQNPSLSGLGVVSAIGVFWCLISTLLFLLPAVLLRRKQEIHVCEDEKVMV